jgi:hypothetical protein
MKTRKTEVVVRYHNFRPNYSLTNNEGGYCRWTETFSTMKEAHRWINDIMNSDNRVSSIYRRKIRTIN